MKNAIKKKKKKQPQKHEIKTANKKCQFPLNK